MTSRSELLKKLEYLDSVDSDHLPIVTLDEYFDENDREDSIAPNQWGYGRPSIKEIYARFKSVEARPDVQAVYVGMHQDWSEALEHDDIWPYAENIHLYSSASQEEADRWIEGLESDGITEGWPYGKHTLSPEPNDGYHVYTVYWD
jgi:hypothetical protein